jgi:CTP synthase (UTP-ammonia lyase)
MLRTAVIGDYDPDNDTHRATDDGLAHAASARGTDIMAAWVPTQELASGSSGLEGFDCLLVAPGSPYRSMEGALAAICYARTNKVPLLGTCGGFQHIVVEMARHVLGYPDAQHAEQTPTGSRLLITPLSCSLRGKEMGVLLKPGSLAARAYGSLEATERYYCNFGLNPDYVDELVGAGLQVSGTDQDGETRIVELTGHPFFMGTLFVPQASSAPGSPHPLLTAFLGAALSVRDQKHDGASRGSSTPLSA